MQSMDDREVNIGMNENQNDKQTKNFIISIIALIIAVNVSVLIFMAYISQMTDNIQKWADGEKSRLEEIKEPLEKALEENLNVVLYSRGSNVYTDYRLAYYTEQKK